MNKTIQALFLTVSFLTITAVANATTIDFKAQAEPSGLHGERGWSVLHEVGAGFSVDTNIVRLLYRDGRDEEYPCLPKDEVAGIILDRVKRLRAEG